MSTCITLGSGTPYTITDNTLGSGPNQQVVRRNAGRPEQFGFIIPDAWAYRAVDLTIFVSKTSAERALAGAPYMRKRPYRIIPGAVATEFRPDPIAAGAFRRRYCLENRDFLLAVGSLTADKRYTFLFDAVSRLLPDRPLLVICGAGPLEAQLRSRAAAMGLQVQFLGLVPSDLLRGAYAAAISLLHACEIETFGLSVLEAMSCGLPVLAVAGGAVPEVVGDAGWLAPNDVAEFSKRLRELVGNPELRKALGSAAQRRSQQFSLRVMQDAYVNAIELMATRTTSKTIVRNSTAAPHHL